MAIGKAIQGECTILKNLPSRVRFPPSPLIQRAPKHPCRGLEDTRRPLDGPLDFVQASGVGQTGRGPQQSDLIKKTRHYQIMSGNAKRRARSSRRDKSEKSQMGLVRASKGALLAATVIRLSRQRANSCCSGFQPANSKVERAWTSVELAHVCLGPAPPMCLPGVGRRRSFDIGLAQ